jgi:phospholipid-binding lipoprotein MlaA
MVMHINLPRIAPALSLAGVLLLTGCATATDPRDPLEPVNRGIYHFNDAVDKTLVKPVAQGYKAVLPEIVRTGVTNFFSNIDDLRTAINNLLQFKFERAVSDVGRIVANTTFGIGGLFDVATGWGMEKHDEDFGQTLGYWGVGDGPFLMLPLLGPSNVRDLVGIATYFSYEPVWNIDHVPTRNTLGSLRFIDRRARLLDAEKVLDEAALDPYIFLRDAYIQHRRSEIYDGNPPREKLEDDVPAAEPAKRSDAEDKQPKLSEATEAAPAAAMPEAAAPAAPQTVEASVAAVAGDLARGQE